jgi:hypothetical protein
MKTEESALRQIGVVSNAPKQCPKHLARLARVCAVATAIAIVPVRSVLADADDQHQQILPFPTVAESTIPTNGDVNPYGVAFVPQSFPAGGLLNPGDNDHSINKAARLLPGTPRPGDESSRRQS